MSPPEIRAEDRERRVEWLRALTMIPTAAGREQRVIAWVKDWVSARSDLRLREDKAGNLLISRKKMGRARQTARKPKPILITAHLDHPAFVVGAIKDDRTVELEFRGGVNDPYFDKARIEIFDESAVRHEAVITQLDSTAKPFKRVLARVESSNIDAIRPGDVARWVFDGPALPHVEGDRIYTHACDDLAAVAAALATLHELGSRKNAAHVGVLLTRAEEIGFIGAIAACKHKSVPKSARLICLENSRSFAESPIGGGPIVRVGDKMSVFEPNLTNRISLLMMEHQTVNSSFKWQRKLMPGGTCEATTFSTFGYQSTCICLPLGNYHNMTEIDEVAAGKRPAALGPEYISLGDFHGMIEMLVLCATQLDSAKTPSLTARMNELYNAHGKVLQEMSSTAMAKPRRKNRRRR